MHHERARGPSGRVRRRGPRRIGLAKASPTMASDVTRSRSIVSSSSADVEVAACQRDDAAAAAQRAERREPVPVPCMSGHAGQDNRAPAWVSGGAHVVEGRRRRPSGDAAVAVSFADQVVLAPHHALGHAGGATGVEQDEVVAAATPRWRRPERRRWRPRPRTGLAQSGHGPLPSSTHSQSRTLREPVADAFDRVGERSRGRRRPRRRRCPRGRASSSSM